MKLTETFWWWMNVPLVIVFTIIDYIIYQQHIGALGDLLILISLAIFGVLAWLIQNKIDKFYI